jgi:hypothetical protein
VSRRKFEPRNRKLTAYPTCAQNNFVRPELKTTLSFDRVRIDKVRASGPFMNNYSRGFQLRAERRVPANVFNHLAHACQEARIIQGRRARCNSVLVKVSSLSDKPGSMGQRSDRHRAVIGGHPAELAAGH